MLLTSDRPLMSVVATWEALPFRPPQDSVPEERIEPRLGAWEMLKPLPSADCENCCAALDRSPVTAVRTFWVRSRICWLDCMIERVLVAVSVACVRFALSITGTCAKAAAPPTAKTIVETIAARINRFMGRLLSDKSLRRRRPESRSRWRRLPLQ